ncbi:hypothetical protein [Micromonospora kangleipakensis]|nr:hypothetical protein [Micromonospora kangleipakensis]
MAQVAGQESTVSWIFTFGFILMPGVVVGVLLGWAEHLRTTGGRRGWRWLALSPFLFALFNPAALAVALLGTAGGYAVSRRGPLWARIASGLFAVAIIPLWSVIATAVGGPRLALDTPRGAWIAVYLYSFLAVLALACAIPHRPVVAVPERPTPETAEVLSLERGALPSE